MWKTYEERFPYIIAFRHELPYFQLSGSHFSRFWRPAGKQVFSVIATASSSKPSKTCNPLLLLENQICRVPLMSAYVYQMGVSLVEAISRPMATFTTLVVLPRARRRRYPAQSRTCAFHPISRTTFVDQGDRL
jgi:hypothetical protein